MIEAGIYSNNELSSEQYHGDKESYSRSVLMTFERSPFHLWAKYINPDRPKKEPTRSMILGSAFHTFILEPHLFAEQFAVEPEKVLLKDGGRPLYEKYKADCEALEKSKKLVLTFDEMETLHAMQHSLLGNPQARDLIRDGIIEQSYFWRDKDSGLMLKSRPDIIHQNMYVDLKTCNDASPRAYQREMMEYGYAHQGAMVRDAIRALESREMSTTINICVATKYPYATAIYIIDEAALDYAEQQYKSNLLKLKECLETNVWEGFSTQTIGLPNWLV